MSKNIAKSAMCYGIFLFLFYFPLGCGSNVICEFNGWMTSNPAKWEECEFYVLLKDKNAAGQYLMTRTIGRLAVDMDDILNSPDCAVTKQYVETLIKHYDENKVVIQSKHKNLADVLDFIKLKIKDKNAVEVLDGEDHEEL